MTAQAPERAIARLALREIRVGAAVLGVAIVVMLATVLAAFDTASIGGAAGLGTLLESPAVRALYGMPFDVGTAGGFAVWRSGLWVCIFAALWAAMATTRVLRGEEEAGRWDLLLSAPVRRDRVLLTHLAVVSGAAGVTAMATFLPFVLTGQAAAPAALYAIGVGLLTLTFAGVGAVCAQLFGTRRAAAGTAGALLGLSYLVRMIADAVTDLSGLRWASPLGWVENLQAYAADDATALVPLAIAPIVLIALAMRLDRRRDTDAGVLHERRTRGARLRSLGGPVRFAWRQRVGSVVGWGIGMVAFGSILGAITKSFVEFIAGDPQIAELTAKVGYSSLTTPIGFVASMDAVVVTAVCVYAVSGIHRLWEDEQHDRLDLVLATPTTRVAWLGAAVVATGAATLVVLSLLGVGTWLGVAVTGVDISFLDAQRAAWNLAPLPVLFLGLAVLLHGTRPRTTVPAAGGGAAALYVLSFLAPAIDAPPWVTDLSPWAHLAIAPPDPVRWTASAVMTALGLAMGAAGFVAYARRDLR